MQWGQNRTGTTEVKGLQVNWRLAILSAKGEPHIFGRLASLGQDKVDAVVPHGLLPGSHCHLVVMLPRSGTQEARRVIEGRCLVSGSNPAAGQFHVVLEWQEMLGDSGNTLRECLGW